jgi:hypothetical protein
MNIKEEWIDQFEERLWEYHTCDWDLGNRIPDLSFQLAVAYFNWGSDSQPDETVDKAFERYLETLE